MRILQVIHDFLPRHVGGSQIYCLYLSRELARRHSVWLLYTEVDHQAEQYQVSRGETLGLPSFQVVHNGLYDSFEQTYADPRMDEVFVRVLDEVRPDVVHIHHLMRHSLNYIAIARSRGIAVVFTLHDYWLSCPNQGQRLRAGARICEAIDERDCAVCIGRFSVPANAVTRMASVWRRHGSGRARVARAGMVAQDLGPSVPSPPAVPPVRRPLGLAGARRFYRTVEDVASRATASFRVGAVKRRLRYVRSMCEQVDLFLAPSDFAAAKMTEFGLPASRLVRAAQGMRAELFPGPGSEYSGPVRVGGPAGPARNELVRFGYVGALSPHKGVHLLIEAFRRVCQGHPGRPLELRIHGNVDWDSSFVGRLRRKAAGAPVQFLGEFDNAEAAQVYAGIDVLVVPSIWWENAPLTVDEARLAGLPVIAARIGGLAESIQHGVDGLLFRVGDVDDLVAQMTAFLGQPGMLDGAGHRRGTVKSIGADARELEERYQELLTGRRVEQQGVGPSGV